jgi:CspA family cold shock protein
MFEGKITRWLTGRGFGFVKPDDGSPDLFVHVSNVAGGRELVPGARVKFRIGSDLRSHRPVAIDVVQV